MNLVGEKRLSVVETSSLIGITNQSVETQFLQHLPTPFGVRLWRFDAPSANTIRDPDDGTQIDALKVIDFYAPEFDKAIAELAKCGYLPREAIAEYELAEGLFREAHFWRPDNIVCAVISGPAKFFADFATIRDRILSEPQSISAPVSDQEQAVSFYEAVFEFTSLYKYEISDTSFNDLVGAEQPLAITAMNVGTDLNSPYLGLIDYGPAATERQSLRGRSVPPIRGLAGIEITVQDIDGIVKNAAAFGATILAGPVTLDDYPPYGRVVAALIEGPHGVIHSVLQPERNRA